MPQGNREWTDIITALGATVEASSADIGVVITDQRAVANNREVLSLIESQNSGLPPKGFLITLYRIRQGDGESGEEGMGVSGINQVLTFQCDFLYPFDDKKDVNGQISWFRYRVAVNTVTNYLNQHRTLGLQDGFGNPDQLIRHRMLQSLNPMTVMPLGTGANAPLIHVGIFAIDVSSVYFTAHPEQ